MHKQSQNKESKRILWPITDEVREWKRRVRQINAVLADIRRSQRIHKQRKRQGLSSAPRLTDPASLNREIQLLVVEKKRLEEKLAAWRRQQELALTDKIPLVSQLCQDDYYRFMELRENGVKQALAFALPEMAVASMGLQTYSTKIALSQHWEILIQQSQTKRYSNSSVMWGGDEHELVLELEIKVHNPSAEIVLYEHQDKIPRLYQLIDEQICERVDLALRVAAVELLSLPEDAELVKHLALNLQTG